MMNGKTTAFHSSFILHHLLSSCSGAQPRRLASGRGRIIRLHHLLKAFEVFFDLLRGFFAEELGDERAELARWRIVLESDAHNCAAPIRRRLKAHASSVVNVRAFERAP